MSHWELDSFEKLHIFNDFFFDDDISTIPFAITQNANSHMTKLSILKRKKN